MTCKVLFLGAGASVGVGTEYYPLCNKIFEFLEGFKNQSSGNYTDDWNRFDQFRKDRSDEFGDLNVEEFYSKLESIISNNGLIASECKKIQKIQLSLSRMIFDRFGLNNADYESLKKNNRLNYLEKMVLDPNYIISLNWDNLCEYILADQKRWSPTDGYHIPVKLIETRRHKDDNGILQFTEHNVVCPKSKVIILKLHGSMGWKLKEPNYLDNNYNPDTHKDTLFLTDFDFLHRIPNLRSRCNIKDHKKIRDENAPDSGGEAYYSNPCVIYPSYNKPYKKFPVLEPIWKKAKEVLEDATEVVFVGYSLPPADKPISELINVLSNRINSGKVKVRCIIGQKNKTSIEAAERYQQLLGKNIDIIYENAEFYFK